MAVKDGVSHWQLRSLISAEKSNFVYFPGGPSSSHIQRLNTTTKECETVRFLSFTPRCLVAENGWVCCGGETGEFTAIQLDSSPDDNGDLDVQLNLDPNARLPLGFDSDSPRSDDIGFSLISQSRRLNTSSRLNKNVLAKSQKLARDRVNCITMWFPPTAGPMHHGAYTEPAAVLANNDKTVVLVGLREFESNDKVEPLDVVSYPDYVNRAMISPDGRLLIAILDDPYLYIHHRVESIGDDSGPFRADDRPEYRWELWGKILLKSQRRDDASDSRGSFAACFSHTGAYLAVGTQYGTISVFDVAGLTDPDVTDPLLTSFTSSRPMAGSGAIRDMAFCPGPFDLLAWTEDRGHVGIADLRTDFVQRQVLNISVSGDFEEVSVLDRATIDPRLLEGRGERNPAPPSALTGSLVFGDGRWRRGSEGPERTHHFALTPDETRVLEALQEEPNTLARSSSVSRGLGGQNDTIRSSGDRNEGQPGSVSRAIGDLLGNIRDSRERAQERIRNAHRVILQSNVERERMMSIMSSRPPRNQRASRPSEAPALPAIQRTSNELRNLTPSGSGWADLEALYSLSFESNIQDSRAATRDRDRERSGILPLLNSVAIAEMEERNLRRRVVMEHGVHEAPPEPDNTAGIAWSEDGRTLYVGAENGIYEFQVDILGRKFQPDLTLR
ncbi:Uncharacterized protein C8035_v005502 [Colletotrichum spinosum]|uniref:DUF2415 domain-containing protein n=1 Tax=Colletotrichum spinosum TaxID=1347390 RepID=A0A4R8QTA4_9PEZI|nr:Uncharacterized protein C8035_v005502 [Colletotrichum spinosum]